MKPDSEIKAELLIQEADRISRLQFDADRPFSKMLFGLWLILIALPLFAVPFPSDYKSGNGVIIWGYVFWIAIVTGAYTFQEIKRLHKKVDAIRKLTAKDHRT